MKRAERNPASPGARRSGPLTRRRFATIAGTALASLAVGGACRGSEAWTAAAQGRITARPRRGVTTSGTGTRPLGLGESRDGLLQLPANAGAALPLLVLLHGAGGSGAGILKRLGAVASDAGVAVLAPDSRGATWDAVRGRFGADVEFIGRALDRVFETTAVDPARVAIGGFSDGATYAVSLGLLNGDVFRRVLAFSPGFLVEGQPRGHARFFISHGTADRILPIDRCSRLIVDALRTSGHQVTYREFDGGHEIPAAIAREGMEWVAKP
jgi:phospholipase/carboxylesterase